MRDDDDAMSNPDDRRLLEILKGKGNDVCADCTAPGPEWASYNLGIFLCTQCAGIHRNMGSHISKVKSVKLDKWENDQVEVMAKVGNLVAREKYEKYLPLCYRKPTYKDAQVLKEQWIRAKYEREEFLDPDRQTYLAGQMEGYMWKRGKEDEKFHPRKFVLSEAEDILKYYVKENKEPKAVIKLSELNSILVPEKIGNPNGMQLCYIKDGSTRNIFVYTEDGKDLVDWYTSIRSAKLNRLAVAFPGRSPIELAQNLTRDFAKEGWLSKTGPKGGNGYKRRWFTLDDRKLMYMTGPLDAYPKGEIFLGFHADGYSVRSGVPIGSRDHGYGFTLTTPQRIFVLSATCEDDRKEWISFIQKVLEKPLTPQDNLIAVNLVRKRSAAAPKLWRT